MVSVGSGRSTVEKQAGYRLREARLARKLSLDQVAVRIRIPPKQLKALEDGDLSGFSAEIYAKGAYTKYASFLGIDDKDSWHAFLRTLAGVKVPVPLRVPVPAARWQRMFTPTGMLILVVGIVLSTITGYISWQVLSFVRVPELKVYEPATPNITGAEIVVRGRAEAEALVEVNGSRVLLNDDNEFEYVLPVQAGINVLQVQARGASGRLNTVTKHLLVARN